MIVNGFCKEVFKELPMEFAVEAQRLLASVSRGAWVEQASAAAVKNLTRRPRDVKSSRASTSR